MNSNEFVRLYLRELTKLSNEISAYNSEDEMWTVLPGTINSGGNLAQHLIGNLRTYIGLALGNVAYLRDRDAEFEKRLFTKNDLIVEINLLQEIVSKSVSVLSDVELQSEYPHDVLTIFPEQSVDTVLTHLLMHLSYHTGQINYHRRNITSIKY